MWSLCSVIKKPIDLWGSVGVLCCFGDSHQEVHTDLLAASRSLVSLDLNCCDVYLHFVAGALSKPLRLGSDWDWGNTDTVCGMRRRKNCEGMAGFVTHLYSALSIFAMCSAIVPQHAGPSACRSQASVCPFPGWEASGTSGVSYGNESQQFCYRPVYK